MSELSLSKEEAAVQIGSWYVEEYDAFQYELASYAQGPFFLEVPVEVIEDLESAVADRNAVKQMADRMKTLLRNLLRW